MKLSVFLSPVIRKKRHSFKLFVDITSWVTPNKLHQ
uniref:Uncharacterized protein n=1 Tax=Rhizophora mucronata TaxID=61149 RepID=A0A2P2IH67_RHIMU